MFWLQVVNFSGTLYNIFWLFPSAWESMGKHGNLIMSTNRIYSKNFNYLLSLCY